MAIAGQLRRRLPGTYGVPHPPLDRDDLGIAESGQHLLERVEMRGFERTRFSKPVARRMCGVKVRARNPSHWNRLGRRMGAAALQELWQHVGMWPVRALARWRRNR